MTLLSSSTELANVNISDVAISNEVRVKLNNRNKSGK